MTSRAECMPCFVRQALDAARELGVDEEKTHRTLRRVLLAVADFPLGLAPPAMAQTVHRIIREEVGSADPYAGIKAESTRLALLLADEARAVVAGAIDPFKMAVRFAIAGNIMDFALASRWSRLDLGNFVEKTRLHPLDDAAVDRLRTAAGAAATVLYLGDNAGETVFDRLLIEQMPGKRIRYAAKGAPVINDATLADARAAGLDEVAELVGNGSDAPGTLLDDCSAAFRRLFEEADLVIAKGQANYESLCNAARKVFFLAQVKCPVLARDTGQPVGHWIVKESENPA